ncbi:MAG: LPS export ABC transporter permease LptG [Pseudomonadota bacterium]
MMGKTISLYLTRRFFSAVLTVFLTCMGLILLVDFVELMRRSSNVEAASIFSVFWLALLRLPTFTEQIFPFAILFGTMSALMRLSQRLELVVARTAGMSVWQFLAPGLFVALATGFFATLVYNPLSAMAREEADRIEARLFGKFNFSDSVQRTSSGAWIRQEGKDGQFILNAGSALEGGMQLVKVTIHTFDKQGNLAARIDADRAVLKPGFWELENALLMNPGETPERYKSYLLPTNLSAAQVRESFASPETISFYELPTYIAISQKAGLSATRLRLQYQTLLAKPWLLLGMALIAATVSLRLFRSGQVLPLIMGGIGAGFLLYLTLEISKQLGRSGLIGVIPAAWVPVVVAMLTGLTILLHQEDG